MALQRHQVYCSVRCRYRAFAARHREPPSDASCLRCRAVFRRKRRDSRYCSYRCRVLDRSMQTYWRDPERARERWRNWYRRNSERFGAYVREWRRANPQRVAAYARDRHFGRSRIRAEVALFLLEAYEWKCGYCGSDTKLTLDHRVPLRRGGADTLENLIPACGRCNSSKHDRSELDFRGERALAEFVNGRVLAVGGTMAGRGAAQHRAGGSC